MSGKILRLKRFGITMDGGLVIFPLDHGITRGPIAGLERLGNVIRVGVEGGVDALVLHKGMLRFLEPLTRPLPGVFMHLSASTQLGPHLHRKVLIGSVEEAIRRGADGVSAHINLGVPGEPEMLRDLGTVGAACADWQMPLLVMIYAQTGDTAQGERDLAVAHAARVAAELGADCIKIPPLSHQQVLEEIAGSIPVPIVVAGGARTPEALPFLEKIEEAVGAGAAGVAIGRNVFQHEHPAAFMKAICSIVHRGLSAARAWEELLQAPPPESKPSGESDS